MTDLPFGALVVDELLEASVVGSFSKIGPLLRRRAAAWQPYDRMDGKVAVVTGATSGLGLATAVELARLGARVRLVGRSASKLDAALDRIRDDVPGADVTGSRADLSDLADVRRLADDLLGSGRHLDVLVHNAGALSRSHTVSASGLETTCAVQLVAPHLLTSLLTPALGGASPSRVLWVSSGGMYTQKFDLASLDPGPANYDGTVTYARVKRAQVVLSGEWARRLESAAVVVHAMHPGWADTPGIATGLPSFSRVMRPLLRTPEEGADSIVWLASAPEALTTTGGFWCDRRRRSEHKVPWTRLPRAAAAEAGSALFDWCDARARAG